MTNELTIEQINIALAKWHTENQDFADFYFCDEAAMVLWRNKDCPSSFGGSLKLYTESLDTMRMIEKLFTAQQEHDYSLAMVSGKDIEDWHAWVGLLFLNAETRARSAFDVLDLREVNE